METNPYLLSFPMEYEQSHLLQPNYAHCSVQAHEDLSFPDFTYDSIPDDGYMETMLYLSEEHPNANFPDMGHGDDPLLPDTFMGLELEEAIPMGSEMISKDSPQQENLVTTGGDHDFRELSLTDLLLIGAEAVESENWHVALAAIARLDHLLINQENETSPFLRLAYFFAQGLRSRAIGPGLHRAPAAPIPAITADDMSAYQLVQELSPYVKFAHFTANQAILEATDGDREVHIIDFDVMEGIQWPPLMVDLAKRTGTSLWITAVVREGNVDAVDRTGRRLVEFADSIGLALRFDRLEEGNLEGFEAGKGSVIANCMVHQLQMPSRSLTSVRDFLGIVRKLSPKMVVLVEEELFRSVKTRSMSFVEFFCEALHHFSAMSDSLVCSFYGGYKVGLRLVEREMLGPRIVDYVSQFHCEPFSLEGFKVIPLSSCNVSQAKFLVGLFNRGYGVQHEKGRLALCWKSRPLFTVAIWVPA